VPWAGVLDRRLMRIANALAGRDEHAPVIECFDGGLQLAAHGAAVKLAVAGDAVVEIKGAEQTRLLAPWRSITLAEGETLRIPRMGHGRIAAVAIAGLTVPAVMEPETLRAVRPMSISGSIAIKSPASATGNPSADNTTNAANVAPPPTPAIPKDASVTMKMSRIKKPGSNGLIPSVGAIITANIAG